MKGLSILLVEDDVVTSVTLAKALQAELPGVQLLRASTLFEARLILSSFDLQFFVIDVNLPDGNGIDFIIDVSSKEPRAGVVVITSDNLPKHRDRATSFGALHFLEKPVPPKTLGQIIRTHHDNNFGTSTSSETSFSAALTRLSVLDVIQLKCLGHATLRLNFTLRDGRFGSVYLQEGQIIHAESGTSADADLLKGMPALTEILTWRGGRVVEVRDSDKPTPTLNDTWQRLLLEAAQLGDERNQTG